MTAVLLLGEREEMEPCPDCGGVSEKKEFPNHHWCCPVAVEEAAKRIVRVDKMYKKILDTYPGAMGICLQTIDEYKATGQRQAAQHWRLIAKRVGEIMRGIH